MAVIFNNRRISDTFEQLSIKAAFLPPKKIRRKL